MLITVTAIGSFASLGIYNSGPKTDKPRRSLLTQQSSLKPGTFSLKSGYHFRGSQVFNIQSQKYISLNTVVSYQVGNTTYVMPLKKKILMGKVSIIPFSDNR
jgi:hypothetical protein